MSKNVSAEQIFNENIRLIGYTINTYFSVYIDDEDAYQEASLTLWRACNLYDPSKGIKFSTYAVKSIWSHLCRYYKQNKKRSELCIMSLDEDISMAHGDSCTLKDIIPDPKPPLADSEYDNFMIELRGHLSDRRNVILNMMLEGASNKEMIAATGVSHTTVSGDIAFIQKWTMKILDDR